LRYFRVKKTQLFDRREFCVFSENIEEIWGLAASKLFNRAARFFWFVFLTRQKNEQRHGQQQPTTPSTKSF
ncbi:MAG: hypothetical protein R3302_02545, partial [Sulfurimonadaceae bacterium]|nr:hypothetical protein [Sulfurimonadaceae bacterium]